MSEEAVRYGNLRRPKAPGVSGMSPVQFLVTVVLVLVAVVLVFLINFWLGLVWIAVCAAVMAPWVIGTTVFDSNPYAGLMRRARWQRGEARGHTTLAQGPTGTVSHGAIGLPGLMASAELLQAVDGYGQPFALIHHTSVDHYSVVIETEPEGIVGRDQKDLDRKAALWGTYLGALSRHRDLVGAQVVVETVPDTGLRLEHAARAEVREDAPEFSKRVLDAAIAAAPSGAAQVTTTVTLTFDATKATERGKRSRDTVADDIGTRLPGLIAQLRQTGAGSNLRARVAADVVDDARVSFDPSVVAEVERARNDGGTGLTWDECGPVSAHAGRDHYAHDGHVSMSMVMVEPPRGVFYTLQLKDLLDPSPRVPRKRVAMLFRPLDPAMSAQLAEWRVTSATSDATSDRRRGTSARKKAALDSAAANAKAEAEGSPFVRVATIVTGTVADPEDLPEVHATLLNLSQQAKLKFRPAWGMHDVAFIASMPLGIVLPERVAMPAVLRETM